MAMGRSHVILGGDWLCLMRNLLEGPSLLFAPLYTMLLCSSWHIGINLAGMLYIAWHLESC